MNNKVIILGSCGFLMGGLIRKASHDKSPYFKTNFASVDNNSNPNTKIKSIFYFNQNHSFHVADIRDQHIMDTIFTIEEPEIVIHAAEQSPRDQYDCQDDFNSSNVLGTQVVLNSCIKNNIKKLIYISTCQVYGELKSEQESPWTEQSFTNPRNAYSISKLSAEQLIKSASETDGLNYNILRTTNAYGAWQSKDRLIPKTIKCIMENKPIQVYGQGLEIRDWIFANDVSSAILTMLNQNIRNETFNVSANQELSNLEVIQKICNVMDKGHELITFVKDPRKNHDFRYAMNSDKLKKFGWKCDTKFKDGIERAIYWYQQNPWALK